jgi:coenzyme F420-0:L-glutamate ligase / coenzyme F420-1:gamma-L-glutamate ligase
MKSMPVTVIPVNATKKFGKFNLEQIVRESIRKRGEVLREHDIVVVSSKFAAMAEGRFVNLKSIKPSAEAIALSREYDLDPALAHLILSESEAILGGIKGFVLSVTNGILAPNSGIDRSNVPPNFAILYPRNPERTAKRLRTQLQFSGRKHIQNLGVILSDSRITPARLGTIGIAIATSGFQPVEDFRGRKDLFGNTLKVTVKAVADEICSAAQLVMGEADESVPIALVRGYKCQESKRFLSTLIPHDQCLYVQGLSKRSAPTNFGRAA